MTLHKVIYLPDARLRQKNAPIDVFDDKLKQLVSDMFETMYHTNGVGLAAPQIGINLKLAVVDVVGDKANQYVLVNPEIIASTGETKCLAGCLSIPGASAYDGVKRAQIVTVRAQDETGKTVEIEADGLLSRCFQHEIDHLHGKLFIDHLSPLKRSLAKKKLDKFKRQQAD
jgi:peptide deformylase